MRGNDPRLRLERSRPPPCRCIWRGARRLGPSSLRSRREGGPAGAAGHVDSFLSSSCG